MLLELKANPLAVTNIGAYNCMHIAIRRGHLQIIGYLMSLEIKDTLLNQPNDNGRLPGYYAQLGGNEEIYQEYFCNKLSTYIDKLMYADPVLGQECADKLLTYGQTIGVYEYSDFMNIDMGRGMTLPSLAMLNKCDFILNILQKMKIDLSKKMNME